MKKNTGLKKRIVVLEVVSMCYSALCCEATYSTQLFTQPATCEMCT